MEQVMLYLMPYLVSAMIGAIGWQFRESYLLKTKVAVLETDMKNHKQSVDKDIESTKNSIENLQESVEKDIDGINKSIDSIQKRQDSHSKKQDEILTLITDFKLEVVKQISEMASDLKALNSTLEVYDDKAQLIKRKKKG